MKRLAAILFLFLLLLQAIPVLHFFSAEKAVFYTYIDEEKPEQKLNAGKEKGDIAKEYNLALQAFREEENRSFYAGFVERSHATPLLEFVAPPPDAC
ncbi:hypothetical protein HRG84_08235 [Flavisolibacter sp. BT320]|nr:hypothetical protein [Flavisolibacter longurius]